MLLSGVSKRKGLGLDVAQTLYSPFFPIRKTFSLLLSGMNENLLFFLLYAAVHPMIISTFYPCCCFPDILFYPLFYFYPAGMSGPVIEQNSLSCVSGYTSVQYRGQCAYYRVYFATVLFECILLLLV